jgi:hypothetical protein
LSRRAGPLHRRFRSRRLGPLWRHRLSRAEVSRPRPWLASKNRQRRSYRLVVERPRRRRFPNRYNRRRRPS